MAFNHWPSLLLVFALMLGILICCKQYDFFIVNEVRTLLSIIFGFATSCLLLSFIWLTQRKPAHDSSNGTQLARDGLDTPSMHPRGRITSLSPSDENTQQATVCTISSMMDSPPNYEDALITSKPVNWAYLQPDKAGSCMHLSPPSSHHSIQMKICLCPKHSNEYNQEAASVGTMSNNNHHHYQYSETNENQLTVSPRECIICTDELISSVLSSKNPTSNSIAQLALSIVRGFTTIESTEQQVGRARLSQDHSNRGLIAQRRKLSFCQLSVNHLMLSSSPPKYCELVAGDNLQASADLSNNSNELRAGDSR